MDNRAIGIFDSGMGGISVLADAIELLKNESFTYYGDNLYAPYGTKSKEEINNRVKHIVDFFIKKDVKAIVIACNTASSVAAENLRRSYNIPIIAMEPALKPAALKYPSKKIAVLATELTLKLDKFKRLMSRYGANAIPIACPKIVEFVESFNNNEEKLIKYLEENIEKSTYSAIVLGCTHFVFVKDIIAKLYPESQIIDGNIGTVKQLQRVLATKNILADKNNLQFIEFFSSCNNPVTIKQMQMLLNSIKKSQSIVKA